MRSRRGLTNGEFQSQRTDQSVHVALTVEDVRGDSLPIEPIDRYELHDNAVFAQETIHEIARRYVVGKAVRQQG